MSDELILNNKLQILGKLTASLVHEIRNPLSVIKLNLEYLNMLDSQLNDEIRECLSACSEATYRLLFLIEDFSDFSKRQSHSPDICSINAITQKAVNIMLITASRMNINFDTHLEENLPPIFFNKNKLLQVLLNLITNALESGNSQKVVHIRSYKNTSDQRDYIYWEIEDHGTGIDDSMKDKIFSDFFTSKAAGTGLGLSVCRKILEEYNAEISFKSVPSSGSTFILKFNTTFPIESYVEQNSDN